MKKRIISLILVVATALLTLTGCAFNYAKSDLSKYATYSAEDFYKALQALNITDGAFGAGEDRDTKVADAIAKKILEATDATESKKYSGTVSKYDALYFCYYATYTDADGKEYQLLSKYMSEASLSNFQVGLSDLTGLNKAISEKLLKTEGEDVVGAIENYLYSTSAASVVGMGDVVSLSYMLTEGDSKDGTAVFNEYFELKANDKLSDALVGAKVGVQLDKQVDVVDENDGSKTLHYSNVKVENIVKDKSTDKVADDDVLFVTYDISFAAGSFFNGNDYDLPENFTGTVDGEGKYKGTVTYEILFGDDDHCANSALYQKLVTEKAEVGKKNTYKITQKIGEIDVEVTYDVTVNWIVNDSNDVITVKYTPYEEALKSDNSNKKTEKDVYGNEVVLNGKELEYTIFPVYYLDVEEVSAEVVLREFSSAVVSTKTADHEHTDADHEHVTEYVFSTLNDTGYVGADNKTLADLVVALDKLCTTLIEKEKTYKEALSSLTAAQENRAKADNASSEIASLDSKIKSAHETYKSAKNSLEIAKEDVTKKIAEVLACKKGDTADVAAKLLADYNNYMYDTLEEDYKSELSDKLFAAILSNLDSLVTFKELPKRAVKEAYKSIMNAHKYNFYEGKHSTSTSTNVVTNYNYYDGNFDSYLKATLKKDTMKDIEDAVWADAEKTVEDLMLIYILLDMVDAKWDTDLALTRKEKKENKDYYTQVETMRATYESLGLGAYIPSSLDELNHSSQFDKVMNFLLEIDHVDETTNEVVFKNVKYTTGAQSK